MTTLDIAKWVSSEADPDRQRLKEAVHTLLVALSKSPPSGPALVLKGGILLAIRYGSSRYTRDVDFSTPERYEAIDPDKFADELNRSLAIASEELDYGLACAIQSVEKKPKRADATFPTLTLRIGYAKRDDQPAMARLEKRQSIAVLEIDFSFNEFVSEPETIRIGGAGQILAYSLINQLAEKFRSMHQQVVRNRVRRQDAYDIHVLLLRHPALSPEEKSSLLSLIIETSRARGIVVTRDSLRNQEIKSRSGEEYEALADEVSEPLPNFEDLFDDVCRFYEALPWGQ